MNDKLDSNIKLSNNIVYPIEYVRHKYEFNFESLKKIIKV